MTLQIYARSLKMKQDNLSTWHDDDQLSFGKYILARFIIIAISTLILYTIIYFKG